MEELPALLPTRYIDMVADADTTFPEMEPSMIQRALFETPQQLQELSGHHQPYQLVAGPASGTQLHPTLAFYG
jgi:hypothetical protein